MISDQGLVLTVLAVTMGLFVWGRWGYDLIAIVALMSLVVTGVIDAERAFMGFGHPAVVTVAAVLVISKAFQRSGIVDRLVRLLAPTRRTTMLQVGTACGLAGLFSAFMNNVGALALMLPVTMRNAYKAGRSPSLVLMPLAFASLLGGLVTLIGTPPNIVIATFRDQSLGAPFDMFDFTPVGLTVAVVGVLFISLVGWRLLPTRRSERSDAKDLFHIEAYATEVRVAPESAFVGLQVRTLEQRCENEVTVMAIIRGRRRLLAPTGVEPLMADDILILEGDPAALAPVIGEGKLQEMGGHDLKASELKSADIVLVEAVLMPNAPIEGQSMRGLRMHDRFGVNLLAMARQGEAPRTRLSSVRFKTGDVLLLQGARTTMQQALASLGCLPLADRRLEVHAPRKIWFPLGVFGLSIIATGLGLVPIQIAFVAVVVALIAGKTISGREAYESIEWPILFLLGGLIPIGEALHESGGTDLIAGWILSFSGDLPLVLVLGLVVLISMLLSDLIHNTPTAVLMAPISLSIATQLGVPADGFLMAVALGSASPYLTPIGHQSNTLVMGPGGYRFFDYARMGVPLDLLILLVGVPMILWVWM